MAIVVEHEKRKREILQKALDVFIDEGYEDATYQKIADRCGITRTTLYIYFKNKQEIFLFSIKQLLGEIEDSLKIIVMDKTLSNEQALRKIMETVIDSCETNSKLFNILLTYLVQLKKAGKDPNERVRRRVLRLRHIMSTIIINGIQVKEFKDNNVHDMDELLYGLIEASIFRITVLNQNNSTEIKKTLNLAISSFLVNK